MYYGFSSMDHAAICSRVAWLLEKGVFRYGGIKLETKEYDVQAPLATPLMSALIRAQWFDGTKGDRPAYHAIMKLKSIPKETVILCFTVTECVLKCWQGGSFTRVNFSEDNCSTRYNFFLDTWNELETNAPSYTKRILSQNFIRTLKHTKNSSLLHSEEDVRRDIVGINFEALNSLDGDLIS
ncbi:hypothetical protein CPB83DRAFT_184982 [Crepidotus variabilis]|uniref:DUF6532 domain-containing protein n=1 Tax=Crepidotus variabilis TaxID=179855 RepID=A0A9P6E3B1_9AGAR|nr:hypothetical protein CPB83DRAFT_184982 [Crepidotus variabilis]